jgi:hypothetical protein
MKVLGIIGIILSSIWILIGLSVIGDEGVWAIVLGFGYFLATSIVMVKNG